MININILFIFSKIWGLGCHHWDIGCAVLGNMGGCI